MTSTPEPPPERDESSDKSQSKTEHNLREKLASSTPKNSYLFKFAGEERTKRKLKEKDYIKLHKLYHEHIISERQQNDENPIAKKTLKSFTSIAKQCDVESLIKLRNRETRSATGPFEPAPIRVVNLYEVVRHEENRQTPNELFESWYIGGRLSLESPLAMMTECTAVNMSEMFRNEKSRRALLVKYFEHTQVSVQNVLEYE